MRRLNNRKTNKSSFTLIESLIVTVMLSVIALAVFATFNNGISVWQRITGRNAAEEVNIFFDKFASDLRNSVKSQETHFLGKDQTLEFAAIVYSPALQKRIPGSLAYEFDPQKGILNRRQSDYTGATGQDNSAVTQEALKAVKNLKFLYYSYDAVRKEYSWQNEWSGDSIPLAVSVELELEGAGNFIKKVNIPVGG